MYKSSCQYANRDKVRDARFIQARPSFITVSWAVLPLTINLLSTGQVRRTKQVGSFSQEQQALALNKAN